MKMAVIFYYLLFIEHLCLYHKIFSLFASLEVPQNDHFNSEGQDFYYCIRDFAFQWVFHVITRLFHDMIGDRFYHYITSILSDRIEKI